MSNQNSSSKRATFHQRSTLQSPSSVQSSKAQRASPSTPRASSQRAIVESEVNLDDPRSQNVFFLISPIGLEDYCLKELQDWCSLLSISFGDKAWLKKAEVVKGGIEFNIGSAEVGYLLNRCLKLPSRILQRLHRFETREWKVVEKEFQSLDWKKLFPQGIQDWEIAASESKINNEKHLSQFLKEKFENRSYKISETGTKAYLRVNNNQFILSRDTSGEHLHFRGYRKQQGEAPLRENLAAFLWCFLLGASSRLEAEKALIIDPFAGSGTILFEAALWNQILSHRDYHSDIWISAETKKTFNLLRPRLLNSELHLLGIEKDPETFEKAKKNGQSFASQIQWIEGDSLEELKDAAVEEQLKTHSPIWLISNPPYGGKGRIKGGPSWSELWERALNKYNPTLAVALGPEQECRKGMSLGAWTCTDTQKFLNGGIRVVASRWSKKPLKKN